VILVRLHARMVALQMAMRASRAGGMMDP
jgi:hypothetical protein